MDTAPKKRGAADVVAALKREIADAKYLRNERLPPERDLSDSFGVARGTLREALRQLEEMNYVERRAGSGTYVVYDNEDSTPPVIETARPLELVDARFALEPHICRLAVLQATERDLERAELLLKRMEGCNGDPEIFAEADEEFHSLLAGFSRNALLIWMMEKVTEVRSHAQWSRMRTITLTGPMIEAYNRQHRAILDAIRARDPEMAAQNMKAHLSAARDSLMRATHS